MMMFRVFFILGFLILHSSALFLRPNTKSNCNSDRQCPTVRRRECPGLICIPFLGIGRYRDTTVSGGRCINYDNGPLCSLLGGKCIWLDDEDKRLIHDSWTDVGGNSCKVRRCLECFKASDCTLTVGRGDVSINGRILSFKIWFIYYLYFSVLQCKKWMLHWATNLCLSNLYIYWEKKVRKQEKKHSITFCCY